MVIFTAIRTGLRSVLRRTTLRITTRSTPDSRKPTKEISHGSRHSYGSEETRGKKASGSEQRFLSVLRHAAGAGPRDRREGARLHGDEGPADHQQILGRRRVSV